MHRTTEPTLTAAGVAVWTAGLAAGVAAVHLVGSLGWDLIGGWLS